MNAEADARQERTNRMRIDPSHPGTFRVVRPSGGKVADEVH